MSCMHVGCHLPSCYEVNFFTDMDRKANFLSLESEKFLAKFAKDDF